MDKLIKTLIIFFTFYGFTFAQNTCSELLKDGLYSYVTEITEYDNSAVAISQIRSVYEEYKRTGDAASASAKYGQIFKGGGSYSRERIEEIGKMYSDDSFWQQNLSNISQSSRTYVDPNLRAMYEACIAANSEGVQIDIKPSDNSTFEHVTISVRQLSPVNVGRYKITGIIYNKEKLKIEGELVEAARTKSILERGFSLIATRLDIRNQQYQVGNEMLLANSHNLTIQFENKAITITFPKIFPKPQNVELTKGIGEIVASMLSRDSFLSIYGKNEWALANGDPAPKNSKYANFIGKVLPDLRGVFLRGKNYDREEGGNPDGDLNLGAYQRDLVGDHIHKIPACCGADGTNALVANSWTNACTDCLERSNNKTDIVVPITTKENPESRPRNVTVNYFVKIN